MANEVVSDISAKGSLNRAERSQHRSPSGGNGFRFWVMQCLYQLVPWCPPLPLDILSEKMESWHYYQGLSITAIPDTSLGNQSLMSAVDLAPSHHPEQDDLNLQGRAQVVSAGPSRSKCISSSSCRALILQHLEENNNSYHGMFLVIHLAGARGSEALFTNL